MAGCGHFHYGNKPIDGGLRDRFAGSRYGGSGALLAALRGKVTVVAHDRMPDGPTPVISWPAKNAQPAHP
jgi:hypothetical protein